MFVLPLKAKYSRRRAPLMVKTCKRHTHTFIHIQIYMNTYMCVPVSVCVSLMGRRLLFGGKPQLDCVAVCFCCTWQQVSPVSRCLLHAHRVQPLSLCLCSELALIEGQGQRAFASAAAHVRLRRRRVDAAWRSFKLLLLHCTAGLCVYCVYVYCVCVLHVK